MGELLVNDYSRKGFVDGLVLRLPTICVRPGKPNRAASSLSAASSASRCKGERHLPGEPGSAPLALQPRHRGRELPAGGQTSRHR